MELYEAEEPIERMLMNRADAAFLPFGGAFELSPICNLRCKMCYVCENAAGMDEKILRKGEWLHIGESAKEAGVLFLLLTGGEPLLHPDFEDIYLGLRNLGFILNLNTNGTLIDEARADFFSENPCRKINITLYGASPETYARLCRNPEGFARTIRAIELLQERNLPIHVKISVVRENQADLWKVFEQLEGMGLRPNPIFYMLPSQRGDARETFADSRMSPEKAAEVKAEYILRIGLGSSREERARIYLDPILYPPNLGPFGTGFPCSAARSGFWVDWQGHLSSCAFLPEPGADLREVSFKEGFREIVERVKGIETCRACHDCRMRILCNTCAAAMYTETGSFSEKPQYLCDMMYETVNILLSWLPEEERRKYHAALSLEK